MASDLGAPPESVIVTFVTASRHVTPLVTAKRWGYSAQSVKFPALQSVGAPTELVILHFYAAS